MGVMPIRVDTALVAAVVPALLAAATGVAGSAGGQQPKLELQLRQNASLIRREHAAGTEVQPSRFWASLLQGATDPRSGPLAEDAIVARLDRIEHQLQVLVSKEAEEEAEEKVKKEEESEDEHEDSESSFPPSFAPPSVCQEPCITAQDLREAEGHFAHEGGEEAHGNVGGDRMSPEEHGYAPIYAKYLTGLLHARSDDTSALAIAEVGVLTGTGLAMWQRLFPQSRIFGFDQLPNTYFANLDRLTSLGMRLANVSVHYMDQTRVDDPTFLQRENVFDGLSASGHHLAIVVDDGEHEPHTNQITFLALAPFLAERFVYFIEDLGEAWSEDDFHHVKRRILEHCQDCEVSFETPKRSSNHESVAVIYRY